MKTNILLRTSILSMKKNLTELAAKTDKDLLAVYEDAIESGLEAYDNMEQMHALVTKEELENEMRICFGVKKETPSKNVDVDLVKSLIKKYS